MLHDVQVYSGPLPVSQPPDPGNGPAAPRVRWTEKGRGFLSLLFGGS